MTIASKFNHSLAPSDQMVVEVKVFDSDQFQAMNAPADGKP